MLQTKPMPPTHPQIKQYIDFLMTVPPPQPQFKPLPQPYSQKIPKYIFIHDEKSLVDQILMLTHQNIFVKKLMGNCQGRVFVALFNSDIQMQVFMVTCQEIKQELNVNIMLVKDAFNLTKIIQQNSNIVLICSPQMIKNVQRLAYKTEIQSIICYPAQIDENYDWISNKFTQACSEIELKDLIENNQQQINTNYKLLPNFVVHPIQKFESKKFQISLRFCLQIEGINVETRLLIINQLERLIKMLMQVNQEVRIHKQIIQNFLQQLREGHLSTQRAIYWYTFDSPVYKMINNILRCAKSTLQMIYVQPFLYDLYAAIKHRMKQHQQYNKQKGIQHQNKMCYRGGQIEQIQIQQFLNAVGKKVQNLGFLSTSCNQQIARGFIKNVFFQINVIKSNSILTSYAEIKKDSQHAAQQQILFNPLNQFIVKQVQKVLQNKKIIYVIKLELFTFKNDKQSANSVNISIFAQVSNQADIIFNNFSTYKKSDQMQQIIFCDQLCRKTQLSGTTKNKIIRNYYRAALKLRLQHMKQFVAIYEESLGLFKQIQGSFQYQQYILDSASQVFAKAELFDKVQEIIQYLQTKLQNGYNRNYAVALSKAYCGLKRYNQGMLLLKQILQKITDQIKNQKVYKQKIILKLLHKNLMSSYKIILIQLECAKEVNTINESQSVFQVSQQNIQLYTNKLYDIALIYERQHKINKAVQVYYKILKQLAQNQNQNILLIFKYFILLANALTQNKLFHQALHCLNNQLLPILIRFLGKNCWEYCMVLAQIAGCYFEMGKKSKSKQYYNLFFQSVELGSFNFSIHKQFCAFNTIGQAHSRLGNLQRAIQFHKKSQQLCQQFYQFNVSCYEIVVVNLTSCYTKQGNITQAVKYLQIFERSIKKNKKRLMTCSQINTMKDFAHLCTQINSHAKSIKYYKSTIKLFQFLPEQSLQKQQLITELTFLANAYYQNHQLDEALSCFQRIFKMLKSLQDFPFQLCFNVGALYFDMGDYRKSAFYYIKSIETTIRLEGNRYPPLINSAMKIAQNYINLGHFQNVMYLIKIAAYLLNHNKKRISPRFKDQITDKIIKQIGCVQESKIDKTEAVSYLDM